MMSLPQGPLALLPLRNAVVFPGLSQVIRVGRERSINALKWAEKNNFWIVAVQQFASANKDLVEPKDVHLVGTLCRIDSMKGNSESGYNVVLRGFARVRIDNAHVRSDKNFIEAESTVSDDVVDMNDPTRSALLDSIKTLAKDVLRLVPANTDQLVELVNSVDDLSYLTWLCAGNLDLDLSKKQELLEQINLKDRSLSLLNILKEFKEGLEVQAEIRGKLNQKLGQAQRQTILREQMRAIRQELGEDTGESLEDKLQKKIDEANLPEDVLKMAQQELQRMLEVGNQSPESHIIRNYLELLTSLPWSKTSSESEIDLAKAREILDKDHYGLEKVKNRIVQQLAVMKLKKDTKGSILLFVGPPGVGKTSLGQSVARALGRKFVRVSLGGVRDDAEIRGHRRTYIGAMPGRIIQGMKRAGESNPVFMLDEIDKLSRAFSGDPGAALLEVLDPEQNSHFLDHYLDVSYDLSKVVFIATANQLDTIPGPLLDRMEVIELSGYTTAEKVHIAKQHLIPDQMAEQGIGLDKVVIADDALMQLISSYTREAGVRELQRKIAAVLRGVSERVLKNMETGSDKPVRVESKDLETILGPERFSFEVAETLNPPGVAVGLSWSPVGGDILYIESKAMPGKGDLMITGQLGDVMKESTQIAQSLLRSSLAHFAGSLDLTKHDLHVHVPAGSVPKEGPSAGVTLLTSLASLVTRRPVPPRLAMTGEITLRGSVLPVGGIKEKLIAAHRAGIQEVIMAKKNEKDLREVPDEVKSQLKFHFVENIKQVLKIALDIEVEDLAHPDRPSPRDSNLSSPA